MDLLATVRKEGTRGGRGEFKWTDVQNSSHREHYLGHSLMAPVGRWQKGKDLNWYAKTESGADDENAAQKAARERKEELRLVKEAEEDAMARALGLPVPDRNNANLQEVSDKRDFDKVLKEAANETEEEGRGIGYGAISSDRNSQVVSERVEGNAEHQDKELQYALREYKRRHGDGDKVRRSRSQERHHERRRRDRSREHSRRHKHAHSSSVKDRHRRRRSESRSRSRSRSRDRSSRHERHRRSRSPYRRERDEERSRRRR